MAERDTSKGMRDYSRERLGDLLVKTGLITDEQLGEALEAQRTAGGKLGEILVRLLLVSEEQLARTLARQKDVEFVNLAAVAIDREAATKVPVRLARLRRVIPVGYRDGALVLAMADPLDIEAIDDVRVRSGMRVIPVVATPSQIQYAIEKYMASADAFADVVEMAAVTEEPLSQEQIAASEDVPVVRLVNQLIREAVSDRASDIHIEPTEQGLRVRYRVDGVLHEVMDLPKSTRAGITSRVKIMADMDIAERRLPQDGRMTLMVTGRAVDMRVASLPTPLGESLVIRLLNQAFEFHSLEDIGMDGHHLESMRRFLAKPYGAVLLAGPTGSGKSTTLYAAVTALDIGALKIITIEDPVEYQMEGVTQIGVNPRIGLTFASGLRTILRADPDVVMIGEMRDPETAEIGIRAALTGHLVLSSIHTNDAPSALTRLVDMDVAPYITSTALLGVVAQRLVRRLCPDCKRRQKVAGSVLVAAGFNAAEAAKVKPYRAVGCPNCFETGYRGRVGIFEIMVMDEELERLFLQEASADQLRETAIAHGMTTLRQDALDKVASGTTSLEEITRVII